MARLTGFSKFLITILIVGAIGGGLYYLSKNAKLEDQPNTPKTTKGTKTTKSSKGSKDAIKVGVVTWGGYSGGQYFNNGFKASKDSRFYKDYGIEVEFKVLDDFVASREAWKADEVDLLWATIDAFPTEVASLKEFEPRVIMQADWSRGGDALVVRRGINRISDLKGKKVSVALMTPSHSFLLWLLESSDLTTNDIEIVEAPNAIDAAQYFKNKSVDAAVVWSPDDEDCVNSVAGAKVLKNTKSASHIIADVFIAKKEFIDQNEEKLKGLVEGWMKGAAELNESDAKKKVAAKILSKGLNMPEAYCYKAINNVRLCTYGDNQNFFNLNGDYKGVKGEDVYRKMTRTYKKLGYAKGNVPAWRQIADPRFFRSIKLSGAAHNAEGKKEFKPAPKKLETAPSFSAKTITINYPSGAIKLTENAKQLIDIQFADLAKAFGNARIRIEGNTDNVGNAKKNQQLSLKRAEAVRDFLVQTYNMPPNRFVVVGNGSTKPLKGVDANSKEGRSKNRRTEFHFLNE